MPWYPPYGERIGDVIQRLLDRGIMTRGLFRNPTKLTDPVVLAGVEWQAKQEAQKLVGGSETTIVSIEPYLLRKSLSAPVSDDFEPVSGPQEYHVGQDVRVVLDPSCTAPDHSRRYGDVRPIGTVYIIAEAMPGFGGQYERQARNGHRFWVTHERVEVPGHPDHGIYGGWFAVSELEAIEP